MIEWHSVSDELPDEGTTVLIYEEHATDPVWPGYIDDGEWFFAEGAPAYPTHWAEMPEGPKTESGG